MMLALYLIVSIVPAMFTWWRFAGWFAWTNATKNCVHRRGYSRYGYGYGQEPENFEPSIDIWLGGYFFGIFVGLAWPIACTLYLVSKYHGSLSYTPPEIREKKLRSRIRELERDVLNV